VTLEQRAPEIMKRKKWSKEHWFCRAYGPLQRLAFTLHEWEVGFSVEESHDLTESCKFCFGQSVQNRIVVWPKRKQKNLLK
jgi:hypothetical protein